MIAFRFTC